MTEITNEERDLATIEALAQHAIDKQQRDALNARLAADTEPIGCLGVIAMGLALLGMTVIALV